MMTSDLRRLLCRVLIGALVFAQSAVSAYACTGTARVAPEHGQFAGAAIGMTGRAGTVPPAIGPAATHDDVLEMGYGGLDPQLPNLCVAHCQYGQQSADHAPAPGLPAALPAGFYALPASADDVVSSTLTSGPPSPAAADPPHAILHCCLRN